MGFLFKQAKMDFGGDLMGFLTFEDETGIVETTFFPEIHRRFCHTINRGRPYILGGRVEEGWGAVTLTVDRMAPLVGTAKS